MMYSTIQTLPSQGRGAVEQSSPATFVSAGFPLIPIEATELALFGTGARAIDDIQAGR
jgi:hypothetical protein